MSRSYLVEVNYRLVVDAPSDDAEQAASNFAARLGELAASDDHIIEMTVNACPLPAPRAHVPGCARLA